MPTPTLLARLFRRVSLPMGLCAAALALAGCHPAAGAESPEPPFFPETAASKRLSWTLPQLLAAPEPEARAGQSQIVLLPIATPPAVRMWTEWEGDRSLPGIYRSQRAHEARLPVVQGLFATAGVPFPPAEIAFVTFKAEKQLEVWASAEKGGRAERIATYGICAASGALGPKRYEGDRQVPEGYYVLQYGWAESNYHLEMKVSYPNTVDRVLGPKNRPLGGEIMIHGACASIGCLAMGDERDEELWVMMKAMGDAQVKVHIYPSRNLDALLADPHYAHHRSFWQNLKEGRDLFEREHRIFAVKADWHGVYTYN